MKTRFLLHDRGGHYHDGKVPESSGGNCFPEGCHQLEHLPDQPGTLQFINLYQNSILPPFKATFHVQIFNTADGEKDLGLSTFMIHTNKTCT
jgi:hypothetical protein